MTLWTDSLKKSDEESPEVCSNAPAGLPSANDELLFLDALDLDPGGVTPRAVWSSCVLRYDAFEVEVTSSQEEGRTTVNNVALDPRASRVVG